MHARIRDASEADLPAVLAVERACFGAHGWTEAMFRAELGRVGGAFLVGNAGEEIVGHAVGWSAGGTSEVLDVAVHPSARRTGLGRALLCALERRAVMAGATESWLEVRAGNDAAIALYRQRAYVQMGARRGYYADGEDALIFTRPLADELSSPETRGETGSRPSG